HRAASLAASTTPAPRPSHAAIRPVPVRTCHTLRGLLPAAPPPPPARRESAPTPPAGPPRPHGRKTPDDPQAPAGATQETATAHPATPPPHRHPSAATPLSIPREPPQDPRGDRHTAPS